MNKLTPEQAKQWLKDNRWTVSGWAREHGYTFQAVYRVINGQSKMLHGDGREIARKLNIQVPE